MSLKIAAGLLIIGLSASMTAQAQPADRSAAPSRIVKFGDLDLATTAGTRELKARIAKAAVEVCRVAVRARQDVLFASCYGSARRKAIAKVNWPMLTAVHKGQSIKIVVGG
jgi:UrcA family protein